jgi:hypothetical protein
MAKLEHRINIDTILTYILIKKLITPIVRSKAYKLGLINNAGKQLREANTEEEKGAFTLLDKVVFKLKRLLGTKLLNLNNFLYLQTINSDFYNKLMVKGSITQRAEIIRINQDVKTIKEKYNMSEDDLVYTLLKEDLDREFE